jgi:flagellar hook-length control protein FliK
MVLGLSEASADAATPVFTVPPVSAQGDRGGNPGEAALGEQTQEWIAPRAEAKAEAPAVRPFFGIEAAPRTAAPAASANAAPLLARLSELQRQMVVTEFAQSALPAFQGRETALTVDLNPPELGRVQLRVETSASGVQAVLTVQDRSLGEFFQGQADHLRKHLEDAGVRLGGLSVEIRQQFNQEAQERQPVAGDKNARAADSVRAVSAESRKQPQPWGVRGLSQVDMMV